MKKKKEKTPVLDHKEISRIFRAKKPSNQESNLYDISHTLPLLLVFLRQLGCAFSHRALLDLKLQQEAIQLEGVQLSLVHMAPIEEAEEIFDLYMLNDAMHVSDPERELYQAFALERGKLQNIFSPRIWLDKLNYLSLSNDELNPMLGDPLQMPGVFLFYRGEILRSFRHLSITDRPSYVELASFSLDLLEKLKGVEEEPRKESPAILAGSSPEISGERK